MVHLLIETIYKLHPFRWVNIFSPNVRDRMRENVSRTLTNDHLKCLNENGDDGDLVKLSTVEILQSLWSGATWGI